MKSRKIFTEYNAENSNTLAAMCEQLLDRQKLNWPELAAAYDALPAIRRRSVLCGSYNATVQFNPRRAASSGAAVDGESIRKRPCFLCEGNLPFGQQALLYLKKYFILCNPAPIFNRHFTIAAIEHRPQEIASSITDLLYLACDLSPEYAVFYNGPACGASAPDHLHFQACPAENFPLLDAIFSLPPINGLSPVRYFQPKNLDRTVIAVTAEDSGKAAEHFLHLLYTAKKILNTAAEPMINLICTKTSACLRMIAFLRGKHRPDAYFAPGEKRIFISPGAVDMAGTIITPQEADFNRLDEKTIRTIYREVSLPEDTADKIITALQGEKL